MLILTKINLKQGPILMTKSIIYFLIFVLLSYCSPNKIKNVFGVNNLSIKQKSLILNQSNRNDILKILGEPLAKDFIDKNIWIYHETEEGVNYFGKKYIIKSDTVILQFNNKGILINKQISNINQMKDVLFDEFKTESLSIDQSLLKQILSSTKKRLNTAKERFK